MIWLLYKIKGYKRKRVLRNVITHCKLDNLSIIIAIRQPNGVNRWHYLKELKGLEDLCEEEL